MRAKLKEISDELDTLHSYNRELKDRLGERIAANLQQHRITAGGRSHRGRTIPESH